MYGRRHQTVPTTTSVLPGASVNIVLKADQPTGRTVHGVVRDVLTRGNHPRGIKVRLSDGRVGRVQSMASAAIPSTTATSAPTNGGGGGGGGDVDGLVEGMKGVRVELDDDDGDEQRGQDAFRSEGSFRPRRGGRRGGRGGGRFRGREEGEEDGLELPSQQIGLDAYVKEARPRRRGKGNQATTTRDNDEEHNQGPPAPQETATCPVCGAFEGDEAAVSHHVASHFE